MNTNKKSSCPYKIKLKTEENPFFLHMKNTDNSNFLCVFVYLIFGTCAAYLSWQCNEKYNNNLPSKILFWVAAFLFGPIYLIYYLIVKYNMCNKIKENCISKN